MISLRNTIDMYSNFPSAIQTYCKLHFYEVEVGYIHLYNKIQIACFDDSGRCRLCIRYQFYSRWEYEIMPGKSYRLPDFE